MKGSFRVASDENKNRYHSKDDQNSLLISLQLDYTPRL